MDLGLDFLISSIAPKDVIIFVNPELTSSEPHMFICIGRMNHNFQFVIISTQEDKIKKRVAVQGQKSETIISIYPSENSPVNRNSFIDCNQVKNYNKDQLIKMHNKDFRRIENRVIQSVYEEIISGVCMSDLVEQELIDYLNGTNQNLG